MAITYNNLFSQIYDFENLHHAYMKARRGKRNRSEVLKFELNMEENLIQVFQNKVKILVSHLKESDAAILGASALVWDMK